MTGGGGFTARLSFAADTTGLLAAKGGLDAVTRSAVSTTSAVDAAAARVTTASGQMRLLAEAQRATANQAQAATPQLTRYASAVAQAMDPTDKLKGRTDLLGQAIQRTAQTARASMADLQAFIRTLKEADQAALRAGAVTSPGVVQGARQRFPGVTRADLQTAALALPGGGSRGPSGADLGSLADGAERATRSFGGFELGVASLGSALGFMAVGGLLAATTGLAGLVTTSAQATDQLKLLETQFKFAFGSGSIASRAIADIEGIANRTGQSYGTTAQAMSQMAISGRSMGMSREQVGGAVESFQKLGRMSGATSQQTSGAMWQVQQMMNLGTLRYQDYRYMASNMGALDDVLAAGADTSVPTLVGKISAGQISSQKFFEYLEKGMKKLAAEAGSLPETMETAGNRMRTQWTLLLQDMGKALNTSGFIQDIQKALTGAISGLRETLGPQTAVGRLQEMRTSGMRVSDLEAGQIALREGFNPQTNLRMGPNGVMYRDATEQERQQAETAARAERQQRIGQDIADQLVQARRARGAAIGQAMSIAQSVTGGLSDQRLQVQADIERLQSGIAAGSRQMAESPAETADLSRSIQTMSRAVGALQNQLARMVSAMDLYDRGTATAQADFQTYGYSSAVGEARSLYEQQIAQAQPGSMQDALNSVRARRAQGAMQGAFRMRRETQFRRRFSLPAIGADFATRQAADIDEQLAAEMESEFGERWQQDSNAQAVYDERRSARVEAGELGNTMAARSRTVAVDRYVRTQGRLGGLSPAARRRTERQVAMEEADFDEGAGAGAAIGRRFEADDARAMADRVASQREQVEQVRRRVELGVQLGQQGRLELRLLQEVEDLRREGVELTGEQLTAERERLRVQMEQETALSRQLELITAWEDAARTAAGTVSGVLRESFREAFREGELSAETAFRVIEEGAFRMAERIAEATIFSPLERGAENLLQRYLPGLPGINGGKEKDQADAADTLTVATEGASRALQQELTAKVTSGGVALAQSLVQEKASTAAKAAATTSLVAMTKSASAAALAMQQVAASAKGSAGGDALGSFFASLFGGKGGSSGAPKATSKFAKGGVVSMSTLFTHADGVGEAGEGGAEAIMPLRRAANGDLGVVAAGGKGGGDVHVNVYSSGGGDVRTQESRGPDGSRMIDVYIDTRVREGMTGGQFDQSMAARYGQQRAMKRL